jgi:hypothetical protein
MARTAITVQNIAADVAKNPVAWTAADQANGMQVAIDGFTLLLFQNSDASAHVATVVSVADIFGRTGDLAINVPAITGAVPGTAMTGLLTPQNWWQSGSNLVYINFASGTGMTVAALRIVPRQG